MVKSSSAKQQKEGGKAAPAKVKVGKTSVAANNKKPKIARPIPKSWPVSSHLSYPPPNSTTNNDNNNEDDSTTEQQTSLKPGKTLQQNCNGCDVFLRKSAVQSTSASIIPTKQNSNSKGAVKRFLIVFPGRMTLKSPPAAAPPAAVSALKEDASKDGMNAADNDIKKDDNATNNEDKSETTPAAKPTKRNPFAPANPPQLLGRLVSLGGADQKVELRIPFPSDNNNTNNHDKPKDNIKTQPPQKQMIMSGRAIPLSGKYMVLSFKRTGGKDSIAASSASTPKNKKMGTGSIACKDIFRSVIVLGESQLVDQDDRKKVDVGSSGCSEDVRVSHYGGSERTVDGGGKNDAINTSAAAKRKFKSVTAPTISLKQNHDGDESSVVESLRSDSDDDDDDIEMKNGSDDEFVPISSKKRRSASATKKRKSSDSNEDTPVARKRTPRRSAAKAAKVKYVDDDSDVDMSDDDSDKSDGDNSGKSPTVTQEIDEDSDVSSVVEEVAPKKKRATVAPANKKRKLSVGSSRNGDADESSCIVIDSDDDDIKTPKPSSKANGSKKATTSRSAAAKGKAKTVQAAPSSPLKSVSPRRRKKLSPNKPSPKKPVSLDLDDDPFAFL